MAGRRPFLSLSELDDAQLAAVLADLRALRQAGKQHRPFGPRYTELRRLTEARLRELFLTAGGRPERPAPHYFVLGDSPWYEGLAENMQCVSLPLSALPPGQTSITYPDSFTAIGPAILPGIGQQPQPYHGRVFLLGELQGLVEQFGVPQPRWNGQYQTWTTWPTEAYIEVQLWSDEPIRLTCRISSKWSKQALPVCGTCGRSRPALATHKHTSLIAAGSAAVGSPMVWEALDNRSPSRRSVSRRRSVRTCKGVPEWVICALARRGEARSG